MLIRFDPFRELSTARHSNQHAEPSLPMDAVRRGDEVIAYFDLPGVDPESIDVSVDKNVLSIHASRRFDLAEGDEVISRGRRHGSFGRSFALGEHLDGQRVSAEYADGVLVVTVPIAEAAKPKRIAVSAANGN